MDLCVQRSPANGEPESDAGIGDLPSGGPSAVSMMEPTNFWELDDLTEFRRFNFPRFRGILEERKMRSRNVVVTEVIRTLPGRTRRGLHLADTHRLNAARELEAVRTVAIAQRGAVSHGNASIVGQDDEDEQHVERHPGAP